MPLCPLLPNDVRQTRAVPGDMLFQFLLDETTVALWVLVVNVSIRNLEVHHEQNETSSRNNIVLYLAPMPVDCRDRPELSQSAWGFLRLQPCITGDAYNRTALGNKSY